MASVSASKTAASFPLSSTFTTGMVKPTIQLQRIHVLVRICALRMRLGNLQRPIAPGLHRLLGNNHHARRRPRLLLLIPRMLPRLW